MKNILKTIVFGSALGVAAIAMPSTMAMPFAGVQDQDHHDGGRGEPHPEYSKNRFYKVGNSEGYQDYKRKEHKHNYRNDEDRQAHDYGYQQGLQGQRGYANDSNPHH